MQQQKQRFGRVAPIRGRFRIAQPHRPAGGRKRARRQQRRVQRGFQLRLSHHQIIEPALQAPCPRAPAFGAEQPASQLRRLDAGQFGGKGAVGGLRQMVALVEHVARRHLVLVGAATGHDMVGCLGQHQRMVRHHQVGLAGASYAMLDVAALIVAAGAMDAFAATIREAADIGVAEDLAEPAGQVAALDIAVRRRHRPAHQQSQRDQRGGRVAASLIGNVHSLLQVEQAEVVLAALAQDHAPPPLGRIGMQARKLGLDLPLQMPRVGADPDGAAVALGPQAGRRHVAERLAGAGAGFRQDQMRVATRGPRPESVHRGVGIIRLSRALLGIRTEQAGQLDPRLHGCHLGIAGRWPRRGLLPLRQPAPDFYSLRGLHQLRRQRASA